MCDCDKNKTNMPRPGINTWGCGCNKMQPEPQRKGVVKFCDICDPCNETVSNVRLCAFVVPTLEEGRYFKNSFVFVQDEDAVYYISDDRNEIPFGARPKFIDNYDPTDSANKYKNTVIYDLAGQAAYVYGPDGTYMTIPLTATPISSLTAGEGITITNEGGNYTISADMEKLASAEDLQSVTILATNHTGQINDLQEDVSGVEAEIMSIESDLGHVHDTADGAAEEAQEAKSNAAEALQAANDALSALSGKQDTLIAGENITITGGRTISASVPAYGRATTSENGLMGSEDRKMTQNKGFVVPNTATPSTTDVDITFTKSATADDGASYTDSTLTVTIPGATTQTAGVMSGADKTKVDGIGDISTLTTTDKTSTVAAINELAGSIGGIGAGTRRATSSGWNTSTPLDYIKGSASYSHEGQTRLIAGELFPTAKNLSDFPVYAGIGIYAPETGAEYTPYLLTQQVSDDGTGTTSGTASAYRIALHSELAKPHYEGYLQEYTTTANTGTVNLHEITVSEDGIYLVTLSGWINENGVTHTGSIYPYVQIADTTTVYANTQTIISDSTANTNEQQTLSAMATFSLSANDKVYLQFGQSNTAAAGMKYSYSYGVVKLSN